MKSELERIWNDRKCRCPSHIIWWRIEKYSAIDDGGRKLGAFGYKEADGIWYSKGKRLNFKRIKNDRSRKAFKEFRNSHGR